MLTACVFPSPAISPAHEFADRLAPLCGQAFEGKLVSTDAVDADFASQRIVMHVASCEEGEVRIPLHVGDDRSRTWVLLQDGSQMTLRHDHRHEDGKPDAVTQYGGPFSLASDPGRMLFPADDQTKTVFDANDISVSNQNTWAIEVDPKADLFAYEMSRPNRFFRIEFDTSKPVDLPPPAWGSE